MQHGASWRMGALAVTLVLAGARAAGAMELLERNGLTLNLDIEAGVGGLLTKNTNFGLGRIDLPNGDISGDAQWGEGYVKPGLSLEYGSAAGAFYGGASGVGSLTVGDGDAGGFTDGGDKKLSLESLYGGWRSGTLLAESLGEDALDLSAGRQDFQVGDGFLIWDGNFDNNGDGAYWLGPRSAFEFAGLARVNTTPLGGQLFFLSADHDQGDTELIGANLDYALSDLGLGDESVLGGMYFQITDVDERFNDETPREGMQLATIRLNDVRVPGFQDAGLYAEYAKQFGDGDDVDFDAQAFYVEPFYDFSWLPWSPRLAYRFAYFSGDPDPDDEDRKDFDPLFYDVFAQLGDLDAGRDRRGVPAVQQQPGEPHGAPVRHPDRAGQHRRAVLSFRSGGRQLLRHAGRRQGLRGRGQCVRRLDRERQPAPRSVVRRGVARQRRRGGVWRGRPVLSTSRLRDRHVLRPAGLEQHPIRRDHQGRSSSRIKLL